MSSAVCVLVMTRALEAISRFSFDLSSNESGASRALWHRFVCEGKNETSSTRTSAISGSTSKPPRSHSLRLNRIELWAPNPKYGHSMQQGQLRTLGSKAPFRRSPADDGGLDLFPGLDAYPGPTCVMARERNDIGTAIVLTEQFKRKVRRGLTTADEILQPRLARCHGLGVSLI